MFLRHESRILFLSFLAAQGGIRLRCGGARRAPLRLKLEAPGRRHERGVCARAGEVVHLIGFEHDVVVWCPTIAKLGRLGKTEPEADTSPSVAALSEWSETDMVEPTTLKQGLALKAFKPLVLDELQQRLTLSLAHYAFIRPHQGLAGATPAEVYFGHDPVSRHAVPPPRGRHGEHVDVPQIHYLDPKQRLPFLRSEAAEPQPSNLRNSSFACRLPGLLCIRLLLIDN